MPKSSGSRYSMSRTCGPRDVISLVIPRLGDNKLNYNQTHNNSGPKPTLLNILSLLFQIQFIVVPDLVIANLVKFSISLDFSSV
jgi:hypothetical protein